MKIPLLGPVLTLLLFAGGTFAQIVSSGPLNSASFMPGLPHGGALATVFVFGASGTPGILVPSSSSPLPFELGGIRVTVNGAPAPILAVLIPPTGSSAPGQINFQIPLERNATLDPSGSGVGGTMVVTQTGNGQFSLPLSGIGVGDWAGGFFSDGKGYAIAQHASDLTQVTVQNPAHAGETIIVYGNDFFQVWPPPPIGIPVPSQPSFQVNGSLVPFVAYLFLQSYPDTQIPGQSFANTPALKIVIQELAPGFIGVEHLNIVIPANEAPGDWALFFNIGSCSDGSGRCNLKGFSSPYVLLPVR